MGMVNGGHTLPGNPCKLAGNFMGYGSMEPAQMPAWRRVDDGGGLHRYDVVASLPLPKSCRWTAADCDHPDIQRSPACGLWNAQSPRRARSQESHRGRSTQASDVIALYDFGACLWRDRW